MNNSSFCHLHIHDQYSQLDGVGTADDYAKKAKELGFKYLGLTNHGNADGLIKFQKACSNYDIKSVLGCEFYIVPDLNIKEKGEKRGHILTFIKDQNGWENILKMLTIANVDGFYYRPRIDYNTFINHCDGLIVTTACASSFIKLDGGSDFFKKLVDKISDNLYCEIIPLNWDHQVEFNSDIIKLSKEFNLQLFASNDCHYVNDGDNFAQEVLLAIQRRQKWNDEKRWKFSVDDLYLKTADEMIESFRRQKIIDAIDFRNAMKKSVEIAEICSEFKVEKMNFNLPKVYGYEDYDEDDLLYNLCVDNYSEIFKSNIDGKYEERFLEEFNLLKSKGYSRYFLIVWDLIKWCKESNILVGPGRGSVGGSLIAYLLGITAIDPLKYNLLFARFITEDRQDLPDIDIDFDSSKRNKIKKRLNELYGEENVANVNTFIKMQSRLVFRDVSRVFDIPINRVDIVSKNIEDDMSLDDFFNKTRLGKIFQNENEINKKIVTASISLEGQVRNYGKHAAAVIINNEPLVNGKRACLIKKKDDFSINWDKYDAEYMGMLKLDILALTELTILQNTFDLIKKNYNKIINYKSIDLEDASVYKKFANGDCVGCFQFNTYGLRNLCKDLYVDSFSILATATALFRPAPLRKGLTDEFINRRNGSKWRLMHYKLKDILEDTYGILVFQEQAMMISNVIANFSMKDADKFRKALDKEDSDEIEKYRKSFIDGCIENNISEEKAFQIWNELSLYGGYGFNRSHAFAYTLISYYDMWCKVYYPAEFICSSLSFCNDEKKSELINEALKIGLTVCFPKIGHSKPFLWNAKNDNVYMPYIALKGIGDVTANKIDSIFKKDGFFKIDEIKGRAKNILNDAGAFDIKARPRNINSILSFDISNDVLKKM